MIIVSRDVGESCVTLPYHHLNLSKRPNMRDIEGCKRLVLGACRRASVLACDNDNDKKWITNDSDGDGSDKGKLRNRPLANIKVKTKQIQCNRIMIIISIYTFKKLMYISEENASCKGCC